MITPLYQPLGTSSHQLAAKYGKLLGQPTTHTGTLDPMAEGVLICLSGNDRFEKSMYTGWQKEYLFTVLVGFATDSHDLLGLIVDQQNSGFDLSNLAAAAQKLTGTYQQKIPSFSAKRVEGKSYFDQAKAGLETPAHGQEITISSLEKVAKNSITSQNLLKTITEKITHINGDFRQPEVVKTWLESLSTTKHNYPLLTFKMTTSKRTYVRAFVRDLSELCQVPLTTFHITRTANGPFTIKDCICLV